MNQQNMVPPQQDSNVPVHITGVGTVVSKHIVRHVARYSTEMIAAGITGIIMEIEHAKMSIKLARRNAQIDYQLIVRQDLAYKFSRAIDNLERSTEIRQEIGRVEKERPTT